MLGQFFGGNIFLLFYGVNDIVKLCSAAARIRVENGILDGTEIKQPQAVLRKITAGTDKPINIFSADNLRVPA